MSAIDLELRKRIQEELKKVEPPIKKKFQSDLLIEFPCTLADSDQFNICRGYYNFILIEHTDNKPMLPGKFDFKSLGNGITVITNKDKPFRFYYEHFPVSIFDEFNVPEPG